MLLARKRWPRNKHMKWVIFKEIKRWGKTRGRAAAEPETKENNVGGVVGRSFRKRELLRM